ncbi:ABC transporter substrate-binding protein [Lachnospiraceae bacterium ZAX-1]
MKKMVTLLMAMALVAMTLTGCGTDNGAKESDSDAGQSSTEEADNDVTEEEDDATEEASDTADKDQEETFNIGVIQLAEHPALDATYEGFVEGLKEAGYVEGTNITIDLQNAQGDQSNCVTIAEKFVNDKVDLILAIATPAAQAAAGKTSDIPILITAVTDPKSAGLVDSNEAPGGNVSGTSDLTPVAVQIDLLHEILPDAKSVGILYCSSEDNSEFQADLAIAKLQELGLTGDKYTISTLDEIQAVVNSMKGKVDAIYTPTDNLVAEGMPTVSMVATEAGIPCIVGEDGMVNGGGLATKGLSYFNLGKVTGGQGAQILSKEAQTATMPIAYLDDADCEFSYNKEVADALGITIDESKFK